MEAVVRFSNQKKAHMIRRPCVQKTRQSSFCQNGNMNTMFLRRNSRCGLLDRSRVRVSTELAILALVQEATGVQESLHEKNVYLVLVSTEGFHCNDIKRDSVPFLKLPKWKYHQSLRQHSTCWWNFIFWVDCPFKTVDQVVALAVALHTLSSVCYLFVFVWFALCLRSPDSPALRLIIFVLLLETWTHKWINE